MVWCGVVWCGVVWCGVVWCGVLKALSPEGNGWDVLLTGIAKRAGACACARALLRTYAAAGFGRAFGRFSSTPSWEPLPLRLLMQLQLTDCPRHGALWPWSGLDEALSCLDVGEPHSVGPCHK